MATLPAMAQAAGVATSMASNSTTTVLLSNIHCPSCVRTIDETLRLLGDAVIDLSTSTVTQTVSIKHRNTITSQALAQALHDAGFDVQSLWEQRSHSRASMLPMSWLSPGVDLSRPTSKISNAFQDFSCGMIYSPDQKRAHREMHSTYCSQCTLGGCAERTDSRAKLTAHVEDVEEQDYNAPKSFIEVCSPPAETSLFKVVLAIQGMTCSACVGRVSEVLESKSYVYSVQVNLLNQSATVLVNGNYHVEELVSEVEDTGYEAYLQSYGPVRRVSSGRLATIDDATASERRTLMVKVDGLHCEHCPSKVVQSLNDSRTVQVIDPPTLPAGIVTISYQPSPPTHTIRHILQDIRAADPRFEPFIFHPPTLEERAANLHRQHQLRISVYLAIAVLLAVPTFAFGVVIMSLLPVDHPTRRYWMETRLWDRLQLIQLPLLCFATVAYFVCASVFHRRALTELYMMWRPASKVPLLRRFYRFGSMDMLLSLGTTVAYVGSIVVLIMQAVQMGHASMAAKAAMSTSTYFDAVVFLTMFLLMGRLLEAYGKAKTAGAVSALLDLKPKDALLLNTTSLKSEGDFRQNTQTVPYDQLELGDVIIVAPGAMPPCDGEIVLGSTSVDESSLTGESRPIRKTVGDSILAGTVNLTNAVHLKVTGAAGNSMLDQIIDTVREGQARRAPLERFADILTGYFVPLIVLLALLDWLVWMLLGYSGLVSDAELGSGSWVFWALQFAIAVLVVACPCGIGLAAPTALYVGTGLAAKHGILVKGGGEAFQEASKLDCVVFDKTGTITVGGQLKVTNEVWFLESDAELMLSAMSQLESYSTHPLAAAIQAFCQSKNAATDIEMDEFHEHLGKGMTGSFEHAGYRYQLFIGNDKLAHEHRISLASQQIELYRMWSAQAKTVIFVGIKNLQEDTWQLAMMLAAADEVREEAVNVIQSLKDRHIDVWLLSGDNSDTARAVASKVGIDADHVIAGVLPHQKAEKVQMLQRASQRTQRRRFEMKFAKQRAIVAMVGDGINDAPALAMADVGIAMGSGSDIAISSAGFVLLTSDLGAVLFLVKLSSAVLRRVKFNFGWALGYNLVMLPFAAGVLYPVISNGSHVRLDPVWASLAMALSSISVVLSSLLLRTRLPLVGFRAS